MDVAKKTLTICFGGIIIVIAGLCINAYYNPYAWKTEAFGVLVGVLTGFFVTFCVTAVSYYQERKKFFDEVLTFIQTISLNLQTGNTFLQRLSQLIDSGNFFKDENINETLTTVYGFSKLNKPYFGNYIPLFNRSPKKLNKYQALFLEILFESNQLTDLETSANRLLQLQISLKLIDKKIETQELLIEKYTSPSFVNSEKVAEVQMKRSHYISNKGILWNSYLTCFGYLYGLTQKSLLEYTKKRQALLSAFNFDVTEKQLQDNIQSNIQVITSKMDEIKQVSILTD